MQCVRAPLFLLHLSFFFYVFIVFDIVCFLMALYMTVILIGRYEENRSATSIAYKKFGDTDSDQYPTFSICFKGDGLYRFNGSVIYDAYGISPRTYEMMLQGQPVFGYEYNPILAFSLWLPAFSLNCVILFNQPILAVQPNIQAISECALT